MEITGCYWVTNLSLQTHQYLTVGHGKSRESSYFAEPLLKNYSPQLIRMSFSIISIIRHAALLSVKPLNIALYIMHTLNRYAGKWQRALSASDYDINTIILRRKAQLAAYTTVRPMLRRRCFLYSCSKYGCNSGIFYFIVGLTHTCWPVCHAVSGTQLIVPCNATARNRGKSYRNIVSVCNVRHTGVSSQNGRTYNLCSQHNSSIHEVASVLFLLLARDAQAKLALIVEQCLSIHLSICVCPRQLELRVCTQHCASRATSTTGLFANLFVCLIIINVNITGRVRDFLRVFLIFVRWWCSLIANNSVLQLGKKLDISWTII